MKERPKEIMTITLIGINILVFIVLTMIGRTEGPFSKRSLTTASLTSYE